MSYQVHLGSKATRQFKKFSPSLQEQIKEILSELREEPHSPSLILSGDLSHLRYIKFTHQGVPYRIVFKLSVGEQEIGVIFLGTRQNFYRDLKRYLR